MVKKYGKMCRKVLTICENGIKIMLQVEKGKAEGIQ